MIRVKEFYPTFGLRFNWYSDNDERAGNMVNFCLIWGNVWLQVPRIIKARVKRIKATSWDAATIARLGRDWYDEKIERAYGFSCTRTDLHLHYGIQPGCWSSCDKKNSDHTKLFTYPWANWRMVRNDLMLADGTWVPKPRDWYSADTKHDPSGLYRASLPYRYQFDGLDQSTTASITVERREWRLKGLRWLPLVAMKSQVIDVDFADEMGSRRGSWKGGVTGCSYELRKGEDPADALCRMEVERKFR